VSKNPTCYLDAPDLTRLDLAAVLVSEVLGHVPYLVGSVLMTPEYRDVDVRAIMLPDRFDRLFARGMHDPLRHVLEVYFTDHLVRATGLRIDFQIQDMETANRYEGVRHPIGLYPYPSGAES